MVKEDGIGRVEPVFDIAAAIEELHKFSPHEMKKILRDSQNLNLRLCSSKGAFFSIDLERLASFLPLHLLACVASSVSQPRFRYLLRGVRLLHSLSCLAPRFPKLEQVLLHEVKLREQIIDLVIFTLVVLADVEPDGRWGTFLAVLHSALVACCLYLLKAFITPEWRDVVPVLLAHPKVDVFLDAAFDALRRDIVLLQLRFSALAAKAKEKSPTMCGAELVSSTTLDHCEASLQVLQSLCEPQAFRDRILQHKELCRNGGILSLVLVVLQLQLPSHLQHIPALSASISRLKAKVLAMLLKFSETEPISFLDEVATDERTMQIAKLVAGEIVSLVKGAFFETFTVQMVHEDIEKCPTGMLYLNAMRLADVLSDDSNFRNLFMDRIAPDLATILAMDPSEFCSKWCGGCSAQDMADCEIDATLVYDPFHGSGAAMLSFKATESSSEQSQSGCSLAIRPVEPASYAQELSSLLVKLFANLHCFNPDVCPADEKDRFLCLFMRCLSVGPLSPLSSSFFMTSDQTAVRVCENLHILVDHVASLPPDLANDEDVQLASVFAAELHEAFCLSPVDAQTEAPVVTYVRDAHEQRLRAIVARRLHSERWKRLQQQMEESNAAEARAAAAVQQEAEALNVPEEASSAGDSKADGDDKPAGDSPPAPEEAEPEREPEPEPEPELEPEPEPEPEPEQELEPQQPAEEECVSDIKEDQETEVENDSPVPIPEPEPVAPAKPQPEEEEKLEKAPAEKPPPVVEKASPGDPVTKSPTRPAFDFKSSSPFSLGHAAADSVAPSSILLNNFLDPQITPARPPPAAAAAQAQASTPSPVAVAPVTSSQLSAVQVSPVSSTPPPTPAAPPAAQVSSVVSTPAPQSTPAPPPPPPPQTSPVQPVPAPAPQQQAPLSSPRIPIAQFTPVAPKRTPLPQLTVTTTPRPPVVAQFTPVPASQHTPIVHVTPVAAPQLTPVVSPELTPVVVHVVETPQKRLAGGEKKDEDNSKGEEEVRVEYIEPPRKRQRRIMSDNQMAVMEAALKDEPELQRYPDRVQYWTNSVNRMGPETISCNQLKNWINNRKAKLAKMAKEGRYDPGSGEKVVKEKPFLTPEPAEPVRRLRPVVVVAQEPEPEPSVTEIGQQVVLQDDNGREIAIGITKAVTPSEEGSTAMCLVEISELKVDRSTKLPIGSDFMGTTFEEAERKLGKLLVAWPSNNVRVRDQQNSRPAPATI